ncbi:hypothetical protein JMJ77_0001536, partial [Colletotrichum scovillei]
FISLHTVAPTHRPYFTGTSDLVPYSKSCCSLRGK